jgi:hypothetical protein
VVRFRGLCEGAVGGLDVQGLRATPRFWPKSQADSGSDIVMGGDWGNSVGK